MDSDPKTAQVIDQSQRRAARVAGISYLLVIIIAFLTVGFVDSRLIVPGDHAATADNILANDLLFRVGIAAIMIMYALVVVLSWAQYIVLRPVNKDLALLGMLLRTSEAVLGCVTVFISFVVLLLLNGYALSTPFESGQAQALAGAFLDLRTAGLDIVLLFVGVGGTVFCYLFFVSRYVPRLLAVWGVVTYLSMVLLSIISILFPGHPIIIETIPYALGGLFELVFGFWLLLRGIRDAR